MTLISMNAAALRLWLILSLKSSYSQLFLSACANLVEEKQSSLKKEIPTTIFLSEIAENDV